MIILFNNKFVKPENAKVSIFSLSFLYGLGVFETLRTYGEKTIFKSFEHINRLFISAEKIGLEIKYSKKEIQKMISKTVKKSTHLIQKIKIIGIEEGVIIISTPLKINLKNYQGVKCITINRQRPYPEAKTLAYLDSYLSHLKAEKEGFYEAILIDKNKEIYEGAHSNIFWFEKNNLCTRKNGVLSGITREIIIKLSPFPIHFKTIKLNSFLKKKEVFLTQTSHGILPIIQVNKTKINNGKVGEKTKILMKLYDSLCHSCESRNPERYKKVL